jgi:uncharacterized protein YndB with AHSA1/START domain
MATITRHVHLATSVDEAWQLISTADGWRNWLVDEIDGRVAAGGTARVVDGDVVRRLAVHRADAGIVSFSWWEDGDAHTMSRVEMSVVAIDDGCEIRIVEHGVADVAGAEARAAAWEVRVLSLWACCVAAALV